MKKCGADLDGEIICRIAKQGGGQCVERLLSGGRIYGYALGNWPAAQGAWWLPRRVGRGTEIPARRTGIGLLGQASPFQKKM
jgi:hypothetical protein